MVASHVVYIDESGDEGFQFGEGKNGSSEWFVLAAAITEKQHDLETVKLVNRVRETIYRNPTTSDALHFRGLKHELRLPLVNEIAKARLKVLAVLVHKPSLNNVEIFQQSHSLYFHAARYLLERVSWCCRDSGASHKSGDGTAEVLLSNRGGLKIGGFKSYLEGLKEQTNPLNVQIDWNVINEKNITLMEAKKSMGQQIADAVASSFFFSVEPRHGFTETRYAEMLKPVMYHAKGRYRGYGIKIWPRNYDNILPTTTHWDWLKQVYAFK